MVTRNAVTWGEPYSMPINPARLAMLLLLLMMMMRVAPHQPGYPQSAATRRHPRVAHDSTSIGWREGTYRLPRYVSKQTTG